MSLGRVTVATGSQAAKIVRNRAPRKAVLDLVSLNTIQQFGFCKQWRN